MKRTITLLIATALILGMSQCKKNVETITPSNLGEAVHITVNVDDGGKHIVYPGTGAYVFENGDKLYVGNGGHYIGTLEYNSGAFSGTIDSPSTNDYLHFYFVGGLTPSATPVPGTTPDFTVNIADQSSNLPVLSYAHSTQKYVDGTTTYGCTLLNKCGLVEFVLTDGTSESVTVANLQTEATISFANPDNAIVATGTTGAITLKSQSETSKWAILLPTSAATPTTATIAGNNYDVDIPVINYNDYLHNSTAVEVDNATPAVDYVFTVDDNGTTVHFSPGNLQYKAGEGWRFAENQYDVIGSWNTSDWVDLFGWGTWGSGQNPLNESTDSEDYQWSSDFQGTLNGNSDWFTLSNDQWEYILGHSTFGMATITIDDDDVHGIVILPDGSSLTVNTAYTGWDDNTYTADAWTLMENNGAVFLPAVAGYRWGADVYYVGEYSGYWSSSTPGDEFSAPNLSVDSFGASMGSYNRFNGQSVRLVR